LRSFSHCSVLFQQFYYILSNLSPTFSLYFKTLSHILSCTLYHLTLFLLGPANFLIIGLNVSHPLLYLTTFSLSLLHLTTFSSLTCFNKFLSFPVVFEIILTSSHCSFLFQQFYYILSKFSPTFSLYFKTLLHILTYTLYRLTLFLLGSANFLIICLNVSHSLLYLTTFSHSHFLYCILTTFSFLTCFSNFLNFSGVFEIIVPFSPCSVLFQQFYYILSKFSPTFSLYFKTLSHILTYTLNRLTLFLLGSANFLIICLNVSHSLLYLTTFSHSHFLYCI
jgi:hypothetical protein